MSILLFFSTASFSFFSPFIINILLHLVFFITVSKSKLLIVGIIGFGIAPILLQAYIRYLASGTLGNKIGTISFSFVPTDIKELATLSIFDNNSLYLNFLPKYSYAISFGCFIA